MKLERQNTSFELTFSVFAIIILLVGVSYGVLIPEVKHYFRLQERLHDSVQTTERLQLEYDRLYASKSVDEADAAALSDRFENPLDATRLQTWIGTILPGAAVVGRDGKKSYEVVALLDSPMAFYGFIDRLDAAPWILLAGPEIEMASEEGKVRITFTLRPAMRAVAPSPL